MNDITAFKDAIIRHRANAETFGEWLGQTYYLDDSQEHKLSRTYYDGAAVFYRLHKQYGFRNFDKYGDEAAIVYRRYVLENNGRLPGYWCFTKGLLEHFKRTRDHESRRAIALMIKNGAARQPEKIAELSSWYRSREAAYFLDNYVDAIAARAVRGKDRTYKRIVSIVKDHFNQWFDGDEPIAFSEQGGSGFYCKPFMIALSVKALIAAGEENGEALRAGKALVKGCWVSSLNVMRYVDRPPFDKNDEALGPDLNLLIAPLFSHLATKYKQPRYAAIANKLFAAGVSNYRNGELISGAYIGSVVNKDTAGKQFNQNYHW